MRNFLSALFAAGSVLALCASATAAQAEGWCAGKKIVVFSGGLVILLEGVEHQTILIIIQLIILYVWLSKTILLIKFYVKLHVE